LTFSKESGGALLLDAIVAEHCEPVPPQPVITAEPAPEPPRTRTEDLSDRLRVAATRKKIEQREGRK
jgi:hypothetical protein